MKFKIVLGENEEKKQYVPYSAVDNETQEFLVMTGTTTTTIKIKMSSGDTYVEFS